jgi:anthranilate synthase component 1
MTESKLKTSFHPLPPGLADIITPVTIYLKIRDKYPNAILLESSDYHGNSNSMSYICFDVMAEFKVEDYRIDINYPDHSHVQHTITDKHILAEIFNSFIRSFSFEKNANISGMEVNGLFGYTTYDAVKYFEDIRFKHVRNGQLNIPEMNYSLYRYVIAINHFNNRISLIENLAGDDLSRVEEVKSLLRNRSLGTFRFRSVDNEKSNTSDDEYIEMVKTGKKHCFLGDVFQVVLSRQFSQDFRGDECSRRPASPSTRSMPRHRTPVLKSGRR